MQQMEQQLKRINPQEFQRFQEAKKNNENPQNYLNNIVNGFNPEQRQQWNSMFTGINAK